jgi:hypothetical protein
MEVTSVPGLPQSQDDILDAALAALTEADIPRRSGPGRPDPDADPPAELVSRPDAELDDLLAGAAARSAPPSWPLSYQAPGGQGGAAWPAGFGPRDGTGGRTGFAGGTVGFDEAEFSDGTILATSSGATVAFTGASFSGGTVAFTGGTSRLSPARRSSVELSTSAAPATGHSHPNSRGQARRPQE